MVDTLLAGIMLRDAGKTRKCMIGVEAFLEAFD